MCDYDFLPVAHSYAFVSALMSPGTFATGFTPLADSTVEARARRGRKGATLELARRAAGESPGTDLAKPLIDTGQYRRAITHVVRDKDADS